MTWTVRARRLYVLVIALVLTVAGCESGGAASSGSGVEKPYLTVGAIQSVTATGLYIAQAKGLFAAEGLHVRIVPTTGAGPAMPFLLHGSLDISFGNYVSFIAAQAAGTAQFRVLADGYAAVPGGFEVLAPQNSPIKSVAALEGKTIAVNAPKNVATLIVSSELAASNIPPSSVHFVVVPFPQMGAALAAHRVDAGWFSEPYLTQAEEKYGAYPVLDSDSGATTNFPISGYATTAAFAARYPKTAAAFTRAIVKAQKMADQSRAVVEQVLPRFTGVSSEVTVTMAIGSFPTSVDRTQLQRVADLMQHFGLLKHRFDMAAMTNGST